MIAQIIAENFKGRDFKINLKNNNLIVGKNGSGKSAITEALRIILMDYTPGVGKRNQDILDSLATNEIGKGDEMSIEITTDDGIRLGRMYEKHRDSVSQVYSIGDTERGGPASKDEFVARRMDIGSPTILNIKDFWESSDAKKIDTLFSVFPVGDQFIDDKINKSKEAINALHDKKRTSEKVIEKLNVSKAEGSDHGSLTEVNRELMRLNAELSLVKKSYYSLKAEETAAENADKKEQAVKDVKETFPGAEVVNRRGQVVKVEDPKQCMGVSNRAGIQDGGLPTSTIAVVKSIQKIIDTIVKVGCRTCINGAGIMVAKAELRKYK